MGGTLRLLVVAPLLLCSAAFAQSSPRPLNVPADKAWQHAETELILSSQIAGLARTSLQDAGTGELDVSAQYEAEDRSTIATVYIYRPQIPDVPLWFDRARSTIERNDVYRISTGGAVPPRTFALPGSAVSSGLSAAYPFSFEGFRSTALAVAPLDQWIVKVRMSSRTLSPGDLTAKVESFARAIRWPESRSAAAPAVPISDCPTNLTFRKAKLLKPSLGQALLGSLMTVAADGKEPETQVTYCREQDEGARYSAYRITGSDDRYLLAVGDAGRAVSIAPALSLDGGKPDYSVTFLDLGTTVIYPSFDRLPSPEQVMETLPDIDPVSSVNVGTSNVSMHVASEE